MLYQNQSLRIEEMQHVQYNGTWWNDIVLIVYAMLFVLTDTSRCNWTNEDKRKKLDMQFQDTSKLSKFVNISTPKMNYSEL